MNENRIELRLFSNDGVKTVIYELDDNLRLVIIETTHDKTWVGSQFGDSPPDDGWWREYTTDRSGLVEFTTDRSSLVDDNWLDAWVEEHDYDNTWIPIEDDEIW